MINVNIKFVYDCGYFGTVERKSFFGDWKQLRACIKAADASFVLLERAVKSNPVHNIHDLAGLLERAWHESEGTSNRKKRCIRSFCKMSGWEQKAAPIKELFHRLSAEAAVDGRQYFIALLKEVM